MRSINFLKLLVIINITAVFLCFHSATALPSENIEIRDLIMMSVPYINEQQYAILQLILFPEKYPESYKMATRITKKKIVQYAFVFDKALLSVADQYELAYDRTWLLYWLPPDEETLNLEEFLQLLYYVLDLPRKHRYILLERNYSVGGYVPRYAQDRFYDFWFLFNANTDGYVYDPFEGEFVYNPLKADIAAKEIRDSIALFLESYERNNLQMKEYLQDLDFSIPDFNMQLPSW